MKIIFPVAIIILFFTSFKLMPAKDKILSLTAQIEKRSGDTFLMKVTLTNNSPDTVKYITWDCTWEKVYSINSDRWTITASDQFCFKNGHIEIKIPPYGSDIKNLELIKEKGIAKVKNQKFKIGFNYITNFTIKKIPSKYSATPNRDWEMIWSNDVSPNLFL